MIQIPKTAVFIPVRLGSSRLPKKPLIEVKGKTLIEHLIDRAKAAKLPNMIVLCTTTKPEDRIFEKIATKNGVECFRGNEHDILKRFFDAAIKFKVDFIVNVDGDDVFCDPELMDKTVQSYLETDASFIKWTNLPLGATPIGIKFDALKKVCEIKDTLNTETGWGAYFTETSLFKVKYLEPEYMNWRYFQNPIKYEIYAIQGKTYIVVRHERFYPTQYFATRIIDLAGLPQYAAELASFIINRSRERRDAFIDFSVTGNYYEQMLKELGFSELTGDYYGALPQVSSPMEYRPNEEFICLGSKHFPNIFDDIEFDDLYFTRGDSDRDRLNPIKQGVEFDR